MLTGGVLLWRRHPLGYVVGAGLLLQYGLTPLGLAASMALRAALTATPLDVGTSVALLVFARSPPPLVFFVRGAKGAGAVAESAGDELVNSDSSAKHGAVGGRGS